VEDNPACAKIKLWVRRSFMFQSKPRPKSLSIFSNDIAKVDIKHVYFSLRKRMSEQGWILRVLCVVYPRNIFLLPEEFQLDGNLLHIWISFKKVVKTRFLFLYLTVLNFDALMISLWLSKICTFLIKTSTIKTVYFLWSCPMSVHICICDEDSRDMRRGVIGKFTNSAYQLSAGAKEKC
jgi:hypothetical protein